MQKSVGYSTTPLPQKLGLKPGMRSLLWNEPANYYELMGRGTAVGGVEDDDMELDFVHFFTKQQSDLKKFLPKFKKQLKKTGMLWVSWPKGGSSVKTDVNEDVVREVALKVGLVDVKVAAIDETWSGLKLVYRLKDR